MPQLVNTLSTLITLSEGSKKIIAGGEIELKNCTDLLDTDFPFSIPSLNKTEIADILVDALRFMENNYSDDFHERLFQIANLYCFHKTQPDLIYKKAKKKASKWVLRTSDNKVVTIKISRTPLSEILPN